MGGEELAAAASRRAPPPQWGNPGVISERLAPHFEAPFFQRGIMHSQALSVAHFRVFMEQSVGPIQKLVEGLANDPDRLSQIRAEYESLVSQSYEDNIVRMDYIFTKATAR